MIHINDLDVIGHEFAQLQIEPLTVRAIMKDGAFLCDYENMQFDGLLAKTVIINYLHEVTMPNTDDAYWIPLPLKALWFSESGLPLWASSVMMPFGDTETSVRYIHKRNSRLVFSNDAKLENRHGRWAERRQPIPIRVFGQQSGVEARVIGNAKMIKALLRSIKMLGKHRARGFGEIDRWEVFSAGWHEKDVVASNGFLIKAIPEEYRIVKGTTKVHRIGWTPPQWKSSLFSNGWPSGTEA